VERGGDRERARKSRDKSAREITIDRNGQIEQRKGTQYTYRKVDGKVGIKSE